MATLAIKAAVSLAMALLGGLLLRVMPLATMSERAFVRSVLGLQLGSATLLFVALYVVGHGEVSSDVPGYYMPAARAVLAGQVPFRDFQLSYAPLFPYAGAALLSLFSSGKIFALCAIAMNALALLLWHATAKTSFETVAVRESSLFYATSGHVLIQSLLGTNQLWIATALAASVWLALRGHAARSGFLQGLAVSAIKFLALLFWPVFWVLMPQRVRWFACALLLCSAVYAAFALAGGDVLFPLRHEGEQVTSANLPYLLEPLLPGSELVKRRVFDGSALALLASAVVWLSRRTRAFAASERAAFVLPGLALIGLAFMLVSKKSFTGYAVFCLYPAIVMLVLGTARRRVQVWFLLAFNALLAIEPSLCFQLRLNRPLSQWPSRVDVWTMRGFVLVDLVLLACYVYLLLLTVRFIHRATQQQTADPRAAATGAIGAG